MKAAQVRDKRNSRNGTTSPKSAKQDFRRTQSLPLNRSGSQVSAVSAEMELPGQLPSNQSPPIPPSSSAPSPLRAFADQSSIKHERSDIIEKLDTVHPALVQEDAFDKIIESASAEHHKQVDALRSEVEMLRERLNVVLCSTWGFGEDGWHGKPTDITAGQLSLVQNHPGESPTETVLYEVSEDVHTQIQTQRQVQNNSRFKPKSSWSNYNWRAALRNNSLEKLDLQKAAVRGEENEFTMGGGNRCTRCGKLVMHPASPIRLCWDVASMVFLLYDVIVIPIGAYKPERTFFLNFMDWVTLIFWSNDIVASFFTGYVHAGVVVVDPVSIAAHYMSFWFWLDLACVGPEWIFMIITVIVGGGDNDAGGNAGEATSLLRIVRVVRVLRLLRMAKLKRFLAAMKDRIHSESVFLIWSVVQFTILLLFANHFLAAGWYFVGDIGMWQGVENWIESYDLKDSGLVTRYTMSLHWSLTQFALGWMNVRPHNSVESLFAIFVLIAGMVTFCCFIAAVTNSMKKLHNMNAEESRQFWLLRRYLREQRVPAALRTRILRYLEYANSQKKDLVSEAWLTVLDMLSHSLRSELKYVVHFGDLLFHPLFRYAESLSEVVMHNLVEDVLSKKLLADQDVEFQVSTMATHMSMVASGQLAYHKSGDEVLQLSRDDWICEASIWVSWPCRGNLVAESDAQLINVDSKTFIETMQGDAYLMPLMTCYAEAFAEWLNNLPAKDLSDVSLASESCQLVESFIDKAKILQIEYETKAEKEEEKEEKRAQMRRAQSQTELVDIVDD